MISTQETARVTYQRRGLLLFAPARRAHHGIGVTRVLDELAKLGFANMADYMTVGPDGDPVLDFSKLTRDQAAALTEVTVEDYLEGRGKDARQVRKVRFKLADKRGPLELIGKHLGLFNRVEHTGKDGGPVEVKQYTDIEVARLIGRFLHVADAKRAKAGEAAQTDPPKEAGEEAAVSPPEGHLPRHDARVPCGLHGARP
jgi:hypothetical protein